MHTGGRLKLLTPGIRIVGRRLLLRFLFDQSDGVVQRKCSTQDDNTTGTTLSRFDSDHSSFANNSTESWATTRSAYYTRLKREGSDGSRKVTADLLPSITTRNRQLPGTWYYSSIHILINQQRVGRNIPALMRRTELDELARERASAAMMAGSNVQQDLQPGMGENVASGADIRSMHKEMVEKKSADLDNMVNRRYTYFGAGTARGKDGILYMCEIFTHSLGSR